MIITCPHCQTRYQVTYEAIGSTGRKVQCAHCQQAWSQKPLDPDAFDDGDPLVRNVAEDALDDAMATEERRVAAELAAQAARIEAPLDADDEAETKDAPKLDPALIRKRQRAFLRRQNAMVAKLPMARLRRVARVAGAVVLVGLLAGGYFGRVQVVEQFPAMAGVYAAVGLPVNVIGLEFDRLSTLRTLREGKEVLVVSAQIVGLQKAPVVVPAVVVTLIDGAGNGIYEWSVTPDVRDMMAGERATFETQLPLPPVDAVSVRLSFTGGESTRSAAPVQPAGTGGH
ncbi:MAG: hypothetical protein JWR51_3562 [Devosia sp.]|uniref:zinc-ribbon domain-containing protein n=1 Tax=Devosia sp. TaxID=1871048 RepID=UPI0026276EA8|nr:zinc-ribbon domain-containing protein [Devosia sp.]MDB5530459.1 hypothetical protein [Devosia sp.]